ATVEATAPDDPGWPRVFTEDAASVKLYQPQLDEWTNYQRIRFRCAMSVTVRPGQPEVFGVVEYVADTFCDRETRTVTIVNPVRQFRFPNLSEADADHAGSIVNGVIPIRQSLTI